MGKKMKTVIIIAIAFVLLIPISVYAEEFLVGLPEQRVTPDCVSRDECFVPSYLRIDVGDTVTWKMVDPNWATITSGTPETGSDGNFESSQLRHYPNRNSYSYTFEESGIYHYYDKDFPHARGVIVVGDAQFPNPYQKKVVNVQTTQGNFVIQLFEDYAPLSTKNFLELVEKEEYDHTLFSFNSYSIMGGDANTKLDDI